MIYVIGPGHGGPGLVMHSYLEGFYTERYPAIGTPRSSFESNCGRPEVEPVATQQEAMELITVSLRRRPPGADYAVRDSCLKSGTMIVSTIS